MQKSTHVFLVNRGLHDYGAAMDFGEKVIDLTTGSVSRTNVTRLFRDFDDVLRASNADDWIMLSGPPVVNCVACVLFALRHRRLNLLLYTSRDGTYLPRNINLEGFV